MLCVQMAKMRAHIKRIGDELDLWTAGGVKGGLDEDSNHSKDRFPVNIPATSYIVVDLSRTHSQLVVSSATGNQATIRARNIFWQ